MCFFGGLWSRWWPGVCGVLNVVAGSLAIDRPWPPGSQDPLPRWCWRPPRCCPVSSNKQQPRGSRAVFFCVKKWGRWKRWKNSSSGTSFFKQCQKNLKVTCSLWLAQEELLPAVGCFWFFDYLQLPFVREMPIVLAADIHRYFHGFKSASGRLGKHMNQQQLHLQLSWNILWCRSWT